MIDSPATQANAPPGQISGPLSAWLDELGAATATAQAAEDAFRADAARRIAALAQERAFAFRRLNLMRPVAVAVAGAADKETAVAHGLAVLRSRLGWSQASEARAAIAERFARVCAAAHASLAEGSQAQASLAQASLAQASLAQASLAQASLTQPSLTQGSLDHASLTESGAADPGGELAAFEQWYLDWRGTAFWTLFETYMAETPVVDF